MASWLLGMGVAAIIMAVFAVVIFLLTRRLKLSGFWSGLLTVAALLISITVARYFVG
jgi:hypothetical protein